MECPENVIAIDFDGTIVDHEFPSIGKIKPQAKEVINKLYDEGYYIIIWTCRGEYSLINMIKFLDNNNILYHKVNENMDFNTLGFWPSPKIFYSWIIDDKCISGLPEWEEIYKIITKKEFKYEM